MLCTIRIQLLFGAVTDFYQMSVNVVVAGVSSPGAESLSFAPATDDSVPCEMTCLLVGRLLQRRTAVSFPLNSL